MRTENVTDEMSKSQNKVFGSRFKPVTDFKSTRTSVAVNLMIFRKIGKFFYETVMGYMDYAL